jgi:transposase
MMRRVKCPVCGVRIEEVEWAEGKSPLTFAFKLFLSRWAKKLPIQAVTRIFGVSWRSVYESVLWNVEWGLAHRVIGKIEAIGIDEIQIAAGHKYMTVVYQIDQGKRRLLEVAQDRTSKSLRACLNSLGPITRKGIQVACTDMWRPFLDTIKVMLPNAMNVLDRFHVVAKFNKVVDEIRASETRERVKNGCEALKHTKYCFLKRKENLTEKQKNRLDAVLKMPLKTVKAYLLKESLQALWEFDDPEAARWFLRKWCYRAMRSKIPKVKKFVGTLRRHEPLIMNWFKARKEFSNGITEGMNRKVGLTDRMACGFRSFEVRRTMLFHQHGLLPEPPVYGGLSPSTD